MNNELYRMLQFAGLKPIDFLAEAKKKKIKSKLDTMELEKYLALMRDSGRFTDQQIVKLRQKIIDRSLGKPEAPDVNITLPPKRKVNAKELAKYLDAMRSRSNIVNLNPTDTPHIPTSDTSLKMMR